jgi:protein-S-isoprenylcysteine O-methyltransferase Ste14
MKVADKIAQQGSFLFRWRSYLPLLLLLPGYMAIRERALVEMAHGGSAHDPWVSIGFLVSIFGLAVRWVTVGSVPSGTSGRNTGSQVARQLNTLGLYSVVKNPLYLGNGLAILGVLIAIKVWWFVAIGCLAYWLYIERIIAAEESFLAEQFGGEYAEWADRTPIFWPRIALWRKPELGFSYRTVLKREYNGLVAVCAVFLILEFVTEVIVKKTDLTAWIREDWPWILAFTIATIVFVILRTLKKNTRILHVDGR